jgi:L-2-hydroxyglutarate oxidase LhgO
VSLDDAVDVVVVGAGVVGAAVASACARAGWSVVLLEAGPRVGEGVSARNSGVVHSGLYNPPGWLKSQACVRGRALLYAWAAAHGVWHAKVGKLVVATSEGQREGLEALAENARSCGVLGVTLVSRDAVAKLEPAVPAVAALHCPETGIIDAAELVQSLVADAEAHGAVCLCHARVTGVAATGRGYQLETARGEVAAARVVNAAGLHADDVAALAGVVGYRVHPCRGDYFRLRTSVRYAHLVYPVKEKGGAGLGVHLTLERGGGLRLGPDVEYVERKDDFRAAPHKHAQFHAAAQRLLGPLPPHAVHHDSCGIRPKLRAPWEQEERDFVLAQDRPGFVNLVGIESPGLTACLDLADRVVALWR